jgi:hypothetical protein
MGHPCDGPSAERMPPDSSGKIRESGRRRLHFARGHGGAFLQPAIALLGETCGWLTEELLAPKPWRRGRAGIRVSLPRSRLSSRAATLLRLRPKGARIGVARPVLDLASMRAAFHEIRYLPSAHRRRVRAHRVSGWLLPSVVIAAIAAVMITVFGGLARERRALRELPAEQRSALLSRTVDELRQFCGERRPAGLKDHCRDLASFAAQLEECRGECEALVRRELTHLPTR